jgi:hypothetical protein
MQKQPSDAAIAAVNKASGTGCRQIGTEEETDDEKTDDEESRVVGSWNAGCWHGIASLPGCGAGQQMADGEADADTTG